MNLYEKCNNLTEEKEVESMGFYTYFREISSDQNTEVMINGKKTLMLGSSNNLNYRNQYKNIKKCLTNQKYYYIFKITEPE